MIAFFFLFCCVYFNYGKDNIQRPFPQKITTHIKFQTCVKCQVHIIFHLFWFKNSKYDLPKQIFITFCDNRVPTNKTQK